MARIQNFIFRNSFNTFGRDPLRENTYSFRREPSVYFESRWCGLKISLPYGPTLTKTKKKS